MDISVWEKESFYEACDVLISGAGLLGLWTARELKIKDESIKVTLIDKSPVACGASTRNAGFACFGSPSEMIHDLTVMEAGDMWGIVEMRYKGIQKIRQAFTAQQTGYEPLGGFECYNYNRQQREQLFHNLSEINRQMRSITGDAASFTDATGMIGGYGMTGFNTMVENRFEGGIHSGRYVESLTSQVKQLGVRIISGIELTGYEAIANRVDVQTSSHVSFKTKQLLLATNAYLWKQAPHLGIVPARGQIIVSPPIENLALKGTFHYDEGFYYFRNLGNRVLIGGARNLDFAGEETLEMETTETITGRLCEFLQQHVPAAAEYPLSSFDSWSGLMAMHPTKQPVLDEIGAGVWAAMCCNGMGVALSPVFAEKVSDAIINALK